MKKNIKQQAYISVFWSGIERIGAQAISFISGIILFRSLNSEDYGLLAKVIIFNAISTTLIDSGLGTALIQKKSVTRIHESTIFYFNILLGAFLFALLFFTAPVIAIFFDEPQLTSIVRLLGLNILIVSFGIVQFNILIRRLDFKTSTKASILSTTIASIAAIILAKSGYGVWALIAQIIVTSFVKVITIWFFTKWSPLRVFSLKALKELFQFGNNVLISSLVNTIGENISNVFIGKGYSTSQLGFYERGKKLPLLTTGMITGTVGRVAFSVFSKLQHEQERLTNAYKKNLEYLISVSILIFTLFIVMAKTLVIIIIKEKWLPAVPYFQLFSLYAMIFPWITLNGQLLYSIDRPNDNTKLSIIKQSLRVLFLVITIGYGVIWVVIGEVLVNFIHLILSSIYVGKYIPFGLYKQTKAIAPYVLMSILTGVIIYFTGLLPIHNLYFMAAAQILMGSGIYYLLNMLLKTTSYIEFQSLMKKVMPSIKQYLH